MVQHAKRRSRRTLVLATDPIAAAVHYALTLPGMGRKTGTGELKQHAAIDLDFDLTGPGQVSVQTLSYGGGTNAAGAAIAAGGTSRVASDDTRQCAAVSTTLGEISVPVQAEVNLPLA
mgnify:CR=1 FL=1